MRSDGWYGETLSLLFRYKKRNEFKKLKIGFPPFLLPLPIPRLHDRGNLNDVKHRGAFLKNAAAAGATMENMRRDATVFPQPTESWYTEIYNQLQGVCRRLGSSFPQVNYPGDPCELKTTKTQHSLQVAQYAGVAVCLLIRS